MKLLTLIAFNSQCELNNARKTTDDEKPDNKNYQDY